MQDHTEIAVTNKGLRPVGDITAIVYEGFMEEDGLPRVATSLARFFDPEYYRGNILVFDPAIFNTTLEKYESGWPEEEPVGGRFTYPVREAD